ncbi:chemotaxis protein CheA [Candidatus Enterovibrio escicola]|uniref:Chemotaxis protein CheA n=1 Tax=Candidatus Enterovibrio escicola TaxID=1927127 RepID=A0A2A5T1I2_9GAMM|nr:chemotaxis protein CheA [Candidatus Enterovibrio escacola]PCS22006.1 Signal transduction histidine kinase CheA [Candidatus Enterovibrio escacola]
MSFEMDEEILHDFLIEAGEILELLSEQLVDLEKSPNDRDLLNAIFRGFHTVKGGAGFLSLQELVETCHGAESIFDNLRNGGRQLTSEMMDIILQALDTANAQFSCVQTNETTNVADPVLLEALHKYSRPVSSEEELIEEAVTTDPSGISVDGGVIAGCSVDEITDDEFDILLDQLHGKGQDPKSNPLQNAEALAPSSNSDDITDDEFEKLLDDLHGLGKSPTVTCNAVPAESLSKYVTVESPSSGEITDDEFENLLDELHGKGKSPLESNVKKADAPKVEAKPIDVSSPKMGSKPTSKPTYRSEELEVKRSTVSVQKPVKMEDKRSLTSQIDQTVRVNTSTLDTIMNMVGELVLVRNRLVSLGADCDDENMAKAVTNLDVVTADLQGAVMQTRMQPIKKIFGRFPRVVRDLARVLKKDIVLEMRGEDTDLDKNLVEALADPMVHLVRNSVDHGIEMPGVREKIGKSRVGTVTLAASQEGDHILLTIEDDGGGMDAVKLRSIAVDRGVMDVDAAARLSDLESFNLIFAPGFSTKIEISDISGRGVGMDVVKTAITQLNGTISIDSVLGRGTIISIKVPLTLAILPTLMVGIGKNPFAFPLSNVNEIITLDLSKTNTVDGQLTLIVRDKAIPLFYLQEWLCKTGVENLGSGHVVIVQMGHKSVAFVVDSLIGQEEVVIKPLDELLKGTPGMAGATITSDGHIALILDVQNLLKRYARR